MRIVHMVVFGVLAVGALLLGMPIAAGQTTEEEPPLRQEIQMSLPISKDRTFTPKEAIVFYAEMYDVDVKLALDITYCESGWKPDAKNPGSSATGLYQFLRSTFDSTSARMGLDYTHEKDATDPLVNARLGAWLLAQDGTSHWNASKFCWTPAI